MQPTGKRIGTARLLVELAARVQAGEDDFDHGCLLLLVQADRYAATVVFHRHAAVGMKCDTHATPETGQRLVGSIVEYFLNDVQGVVGAGVHAGPLPDRLQALEHPDRSFIVAGYGQFGSVIERQQRLYFTDTAAHASDWRDGRIHPHLLILHTLHGRPLVVCLQENAGSAGFRTAAHNRRRMAADTNFIFLFFLQP